MKKNLMNVNGTLTRIEFRLCVSVRLLGVRNNFSFCHRLFFQPFLNFWETTSDGAACRRLSSPLFRVVWRSSLWGLGKPRAEWN